MHGVQILLYLLEPHIAPLQLCHRHARPRDTSKIPLANVSRPPDPKDLLDDVSETEDIITRNKALERGDKLMAAFWGTLGVSAAPSAAAAASATAMVSPSTETGQCDVRSTAVATKGATMAGVVTVMAATRASHTTSANKNTSGVAGKGATGRGAKGTERGEQQVPGPGGALSPETASRCLQLLAEAKEAYDGQGFAQQADGAAR